MNMKSQINSLPWTMHREFRNKKTKTLQFRIRDNDNGLVAILHLRKLRKREVV